MRIVLRLKGGIGNQLFQLYHTYQLYSNAPQGTKVILNPIRLSNHKTKYPDYVSQLYDLEAMFPRSLIRAKEFSFWTGMSEIVHFIDSIINRCFNQQGISHLLMRKLEKISKTIFVHDYYIWKYSENEYRQFTLNMRHCYRPRAKDWSCEKVPPDQLFVHIRGLDFVTSSFTSLEEDRLFYRNAIHDMHINFNIDNINVLTDDPVYASDVLGSIEYSLLSAATNPRYTDNAFRDFKILSEARLRVFKGSSFATWANFHSEYYETRLFRTNQNF